MQVSFVAFPAEPMVVTELSALYPANPFASAGFFESRREIGELLWVIGLSGDGQKLEEGCGAFLRKGRLSRTLEIPSLPRISVESSFWSGLLKFCRTHGVTELVLDTFCSPAAVRIPTLGRHCTKRPRLEFLLDLGGDLTTRLSSNHKRNLKKARKAGIEVVQTTSVKALQVHHALIRQSLDRRRARGENVAQTDSVRGDEAILKSGAGELFQAVHGATVHSSVLVLHAPKGAYYQSAGTSTEGMNVGASHLLIHSIADRLTAEGATIFNLGGADPDSSLARFKQDFGAWQVPLISASCDVGPRWRRWVSRAFTLVRTDQKQLKRLLIGRTSRLIVYAVDSSTAHAPRTHAGFTLRLLTADDLRSLSAGDTAFRERQLTRLGRFGTSYAYGVFDRGQIAHISWLLPASAMERDLPRVLKPKQSEAEITCCETLPEFRGRGLYTFAIRELMEVARQQGVRRIFMKTLVNNKSSRAGIEKAGLKRVGSAILLQLPGTREPVVWRLF